MGLLQQEIKELRQMLKHYDAGKYDREHIQTKVAVYSQIEKRSRLILQALALGAKYGKSRFNQVLKIGLLGDGTVIDLSPEEINEEKVLCPLRDRHITRSACLEYSGEVAHFEDCKNCETGLVNKGLMCPEPTSL